MAYCSFTGKKNRARGAAESREETPKEGIYSQRLYGKDTPECTIVNHFYFCLINVPFA
jgi:hypothetical protein